MKKTLPSIRVEEETLEQIEQSIKKFNKSNLIKISIQEFRRISYDIFSQIILQNKQEDIKNLLQMQ